MSEEITNPLMRDLTECMRQYAIGELDRDTAKERAISAIEKATREQLVDGTKQAIDHNLDALETQHILHQFQESLQMLHEDNGTRH